MPDITAIILTRNEEKNLADCLRSIEKFCSRRVVIDCGSTDRTVDIAKGEGAEVYFHEFEYYAKQFNWAIDNISVSTKWILRIDADERMTDDVINESVKAMEDLSVTGIAMEATYYFLDRPINHGISKKRKVMLFKYGIGRIEDRRRDAHSVVSSGNTVLIKSRFIHRDFKDITSYVNRYNWYATREMMDYVESLGGKDNVVNADRSINRQRKRKFGLYYKAPKFLRALMWFTYNYIFKLGFLDGREGYVYHFLECYWYRCLVDAKILEYEKTGVLPKKLGALE